jgi:hypothetical protein
MKIKRLLQATCAVFFIAGLSAQAQNQLVFVFKGSCATTDSNGHITSQPINNQTLLTDYAQANGLGTNISGLGLTYHVGGNELGDTIDVINRTNGATLFTIFGLYFGESFGRMALLSSSGQQLRRIEYIYTDQNSHSVGSASLTDYYFLDGNGNTNATYVLGQMQYLVMPNNNHTNTQVCTGSFYTLRPWNFTQ